MKFHVTAEAGLRLLLVMVRDCRLSIEAAMACFEDEPVDAEIVSEMETLSRSYANALGVIRQQADEIRTLTSKYDEAQLRSERYDANAQEAGMLSHQYRDKAEKLSTALHDLYDLVSKQGMDEEFRKRILYLIDVAFLPTT